jgi:hypothetical protein
LEIKESDTQMKPRLKVITTPKKIIKGQMLAVQAYVYDADTGLPLIYKKLYMQIIDPKGIEVWPLSTIAENTSQLNKLISTNQLDKGLYQLRVSISKKLSPMSYSFFEIEKKPIGLGFLPLIPAILLGRPTDTKQEKIDSNILQPTEKLVKIIRLFYQTEIDARVCPICIGHREVSFARGGWDPEDPNIPVIGPEEFGGDTHWGCRCHFDVTTDFMIQEQHNAQLAEIYDVYKAAQTANQYFNDTRLINE